MNDYGNTFLTLAEMEYLEKLYDEKFPDGIAFFPISEGVSINTKHDALIALKGQNTGDFNGYITKPRDFYKSEEPVKKRKRKMKIEEIKE